MLWPRVLKRYNSTSAIKDSIVPACLKSFVNGADAKRTHAGSLRFKAVVKMYEVALAGPTAMVPSSDKIGEATKNTPRISFPSVEGN